MADTKVVVFILADEHYGVPIEQVERILNEQKTTRLPRTPAMFLGVFDLRGETLPAVDLRKRFDFPDREQEGNFVVVQTPKGRCALRVDSVKGIFTFSDEIIDRHPDLVKSDGDEFLAGVARHNDDLVVMLDVAHVIPEDVHKAASKGAKRPVAAAA